MNGIKFPIVMVSLFVTVGGCGTANAENVVKLGSIVNESSILMIGKAPVKKKINLKLGALRTDEAHLPNGVLTLSGRARLRAKLARQRQSAVSRANRKRKTSNSSEPTDYSDSTSDSYDSNPENSDQIMFE